MAQSSRFVVCLLILTNASAGKQTTKKNKQNLLAGNDPKASAHSENITENQFLNGSQGTPNGRLKENRISARPAKPGATVRTVIIGSERRKSL
jgi:hypothetical protein